MAWKLLQGQEGAERLAKALRLFTSGVNWSLLTVGLLQDNDTSSQWWQILSFSFYLRRVKYQRHVSPLQKTSIFFFSGNVW